MGPLAVATCAALALFYLRPGLVGTLLILFLSGLGACYQLAANAAFVSAAPQEQRSQAFGLAQGGMSLGQGIVMILAGAAAEHHSPARVIAICGAVGAVAALVIAINPARDRGRHRRADAIAPSRPSV
jgi:predicted MFS family arabinose efflux permease